MAVIATSEWLTVASEEVASLATGTLGLEPVSIGAASHEARLDQEGAYITLHGNGDPVELGILSTKEGCLALGKALMGMGEEEELADAELADALGEIANIAAGTIKTRLSEKDPTLKLGLPMYVRGRVLPSNHQETVSAELVLGTHKGQVVVIRPCPGSTHA